MPNIAILGSDIESLRRMKIKAKALLRETQEFIKPAARRTQDVTMIAAPNRLAVSIEILLSTMREQEQPTNAEIMRGMGQAYGWALRACVPVDQRAAFLADLQQHMEREAFAEAPAAEG